MKTKVGVQQKHTSSPKINISISDSSVVMISASATCSCQAFYKLYDKVDNS